MVQYTKSCYNTIIIPENISDVCFEGYADYPRESDQQGAKGTSLNLIYEYYRNVNS